MAALPTSDSDIDLGLLPLILKAIRRRREMGVADVAKAMGMATRTYADFEAGRTQLNVARIHQFAKVVGADPYAILVALEIRSPAFALRCMDQQLMSFLMSAIQDFDARAPDSIARLDPRKLIAVFREMFDGLIEESRELDSQLEKWMLDRSLHETPRPDEPDHGEEHDPGDPTGGGEEPEP
jgi:transcriptional regulator with XRE-family HTH domain